MKKAISGGLIIIIIIIIFSPVYGFMGDSGFNGGVSCGDSTAKTMDYAETVFVSGKPILMTGTVAVKKTVKNDSKSYVFSYSLKNDEFNATLTRNVSYSSTISTKDNGQEIEETIVSGTPQETLILQDNTYTLNKMDFTRSILKDKKPAINYAVGEIYVKKYYSVTPSATSSQGNNQKADKTVVLTITGKTYGYEQYWSSIEKGKYNYIVNGSNISADKNDTWSGTAKVECSSISLKSFKYFENEPTQISFNGGYVQSQDYIMEMSYASSMPEFDANGYSTGRIIEKADNYKNQQFPKDVRLPVPEMMHLRGHWAENDIKRLYSLEVFKENSNEFLPEQYIRRDEFVSAIVKVAKAVPSENQKSTVAPMTSTTTTALKKPKKSELPFEDIIVDSEFYLDILDAYKRKLIEGKSQTSFAPYDYLTLSEAVTIIVRAVGLKNIAPNGAPVTNFVDNNMIPEYALEYVYVAHKIGLVKGNPNGYLYPREKLTKSRASALLNRFVDYLCTGILEDYRQN